ncbi:MAG: calcium/sodium antiporter [Gemmatimonadetes bacterium]|nr:calcium/sodium antiporter [Gemmatimonadota bacterium]
MHVLLLLGGMGVLYFGADWLVRGAARLASALGVSAIVVGLTVVSLGTSAPELVVCLVAALQGNSDLAMGNVMGSNLANLGLILGLTAVVRPLQVASRVTKREIPLMLIITALLYPLAMNGELDRLDGMALLVYLGAYLVFVFRTVVVEDPGVLGEYEEFAREAQHTDRGVRASDIGLVVAGCAGLVLGGYAIVEGAVYVADALGVPQVIIGLTLVAIGTSLPELATTLVAALRDESDIAVGNIIGSNIFNVAAILGITSIVTPVSVAPSVLSQELPAVLLVSLLVVPLARGGAITRWQGGVLLASYAGVGFWLL